jgi:hypothetical protein
MGARVGLGAQKNGTANRYDFQCFTEQLKTGIDGTKLSRIGRDRFSPAKTRTPETSCISMGQKRAGPQRLKQRCEPAFFTMQEMGECL